MTTLLATAVFLLTAMLLVVWAVRARAARRLQHALNVFAEREIARTRMTFQRRGHS